MIHALCCVRYASFFLLVTTMILARSTHAQGSEDGPAKVPSLRENTPSVAAGNAGILVWPQTRWMELLTQLGRFDPVSPIELASLPFPLAGKRNALTQDIAAKAERETWSGRLVTPDGSVLPAGTRLQGGLEYHRSHRDVPPPFQFGLQPSLDGVVVIGEGGRFEVSKPFTPQGYDPWLHLERKGADGTRERAFHRIGDDLGTVVLRRQEVLATGRVQDETGRPVPFHAYRLDVATADPHLPPARELLDARWNLETGHFRLEGFRHDGEYLVTASYLHHGPHATPVPFDLGVRDLVVTLPTTGIAQFRLLTPEPFPDRAVFAVLHDLERNRTERRWLIPGDVTNVRLLTGRHRIHQELNGVPIGEPIELVIEPHRNHELPPLDLRSEVRVFAIEVVDPEGKPIPTARVRVVGSSNQPASRQRVTLEGRPPYLILVATEQPTVDLEVSEFGSSFLPRIIEGVDGDRVITLKRKEN